MKKCKKILLIVSVICILAGCVMMASAWFSLLDMESDEIATMQFEEKTHTITDAFSQINISTVNSSIKILPSTDGSCRVICDDNEKLYHEVSVQKVEDGSVLYINQCDEWEWYEALGGLHWEEDPVLTVYLPETEYEILHAASGSGDITVAPDFSFRTLYTRAISGNTSLSEIKAGFMTVYSSSGDIAARTVQVENDAYLENVSGFTQVEDLTSSALTVVSSSGDTVMENISSGRLGISSISGYITLLRGHFSDSTHFEASSGQIVIVDSLCGDQTLHTVSGNVTLQSVQTTAMELGSSSGTLALWDVTCSKNAHYQTVSGEIMFSGLDAENLDFVTSSGDVSGDLLSSKNFITETASGYIEVPPSVEDAGTCYVNTASGNINIVIKP